MQSIPPEGRKQQRRSRSPQARASITPFCLMRRIYRRVCTCMRVFFRSSLPIPFFFCPFSSPPGFDRNPGLTAPLARAWAFSYQKRPIEGRNFRWAFLFYDLKNGKEMQSRPFWICRRMVLEGNEKNTSLPLVKDKCIQIKVCLKGLTSNHPPLLFPFSDQSPGFSIPCYSRFSFTHLLFVSHPTTIHPVCSLYSPVIIHSRLLAKGCLVTSFARVQSTMVSSSLSSETCFEIVLLI